MAKRNFYALKTNEGNEIFDNWDACSKARKGHTGIAYKAFATEEMAQAWLDGKDVVYAPITDAPGRVTIYTDGSFNQDTNNYGWGWIAAAGSDYTDCGMGTDTELAKQKNVAGEMMAAMKAVQWALKKGFKEIELRYDYAGVGNWPTGKFKVAEDNQYAQKYADWMRRMGEKITIVYTQIPGHSGDAWNEIADELAKKGCGLS